MPKHKKTMQELAMDLNLKFISTQILTLFFYTFEVTFEEDTLPDGSSVYVCDTGELKNFFIFTLNIVDENSIEFSLYNPRHVCTYSIPIGEYSKFRPVNLFAFCTSCVKSMSNEYSRMTNIESKKDTEENVTGSNAIEHIRHELKRIKGIEHVNPLERVKIIYDDDTCTYHVGENSSIYKVGNYVYHDGSRTVTIVNKSEVH